MMARGLLIAASVAMTAASANAEPAKAPVQQPAQKAEMVLAAADLPARVEASPTASDSAVPAPVKRPRAARVTTCRCGDSASPR